jgi:predicted DNA-binding protein
MTSSFKLPKTLHQRLKIAAAVEGREMSDLVAEALETYLAKSGIPRNPQRASRGAK